jgi:N-acetylmuramoyl-L-alanine amidase
LGASAKPASASQIIFKVQFFTSTRLLAQSHADIKNLKGVEYYKEKGIYKYTCGASLDYNKVLKTQKEVAVHFKDAFIVAFRDGKRMDIHQAIRIFKEKNK